MKIVLAATGASGAIYLQRLLSRLDADAHEIHLVFSTYARQVVHEELGELVVPPGVRQHGDKTMNVPFVSGSARFDAMVIVPCSMGTLGRIAAGTSDSTILRAADVFLKERRKLLLVPREMPWNLIHARNVVTLLEAGATMLTEQLLKLVAVAGEDLGLVPQLRKLSAPVIKTRRKMVIGAPRDE
jgi:4-hydroxy-3-polyprenylbenzoate decarboxylase